MTRATQAPALAAGHPGGSAAAERAGLAAMVAGGALLGTLGVFLLESGQPPLLAVWFRCAFGLLALTAWLAASDRLAGLWPRGGSFGGASAHGLPHWPLLANAALTLLNWWLFFAAVQHLPIGVATVVVNVQPFWIIALAALLWRQWPSRRQLAATALALVELVLATGLAEVGHLAAADAATLSALALCLLASLSYAAATLVAHRSAAAGTAPWRLAWWQCALGTLVLLPVPLLQGWPAWGPAWGWLAGLGVLHTGLAYVLLYAGMARLDTARVALLQFVYPGVAIAVDAAVYGRVLGPGQALGVLLMGVALWQARPRPSSA